MENNSGGGYISETLNDAMLNGAILTLENDTETATGNVVAYAQGEIVLRDAENNVRTFTGPFHRMSFRYGGAR